MTDEHPQQHINPHKPIELTLMRKASMFEVKSIKNSTWVIPGDFMNRETAQKYCETPGWEVTIVDNDIIQMFLGGVVSKATTII